MTPPSAKRYLESPPCSRCGEATRIYGIEPHAATPRTDILTYVCDACQTTEVCIVASAAMQ
jgi:hypothetical protein